MLVGGIVYGLTKVALGDRIATALGGLVFVGGHLMSLVELFACARCSRSEKLAGWLAAYWLLGVPAALLLTRLIDN